MSATHVSLGSSLTPTQEAVLISKLCNLDGVSTVPMFTCGKDILICYDGLPDSDGSE